VQPLKYKVVALGFSISDQWEIKWPWL